MRPCKSDIVIFRVREIPDPADLRYQAAAQGSVRKSIYAGGESLLHQISHMAPEAVSAELLYVFVPECDGTDRQSRLQVYVRLWAADPELAQRLSLLIIRGELSRFYGFERLDSGLNLPKALAASCDIVRRQDFLKPLYGCEENKNIPNEYFSICPLIPHDEHDFSTEDRVLDGIQEPLVISIRLAPTDTVVEQHGMTGLMDRLHAINHSKEWRRDGFGNLHPVGTDAVDPLGGGREWDSLNRADPLADEVRRSLRDIHQALCEKPHLYFSIRVMAQTCATAQLMASTFAGSAFQEGDYRLVPSRKGEQLFDDTVGAESNQRIQPPESYKYVLPPSKARGSEGLGRLMQLAPVAELVPAFRLPVGSAFSPLCIRRNTDPPYEAGDQMLVLGFDEQGIQGNPNPKPIALPLRLLTEHMGIFGVPGRGKTTSNFNIIFQLHEKGIPSLVIETAKTEYRVTKKYKNHKDKRYRELARRMEVYTAAVEECSPSRFNPLQVLDGIKFLAHVENLMESCDATVPMPPYVRSILREALLDLYYARSEIEPTMVDLYAKATEVLAQTGYEGEVLSNIRGVLNTRIGDLTRGMVGSFFASPESIPDIPHLMTTPTVVELDALTKDLKCTVTLLLLTAIREYLRTLPPAKGLRFVILIEECHNVFGRGGTARPSEEAADPGAYVAAFISTLLAELRALGVGVILSEQFPSRIDPMALKCTSTKLAFQQVHGQDREDLAVSMLLSASEAEELARLKPGEAFLFRQGYFRPLRIRTTNLHQELDLTQFPSNEDLREIIRREPWYGEATKTRLRAELGQLQAAMDALGARKIQIVNELQVLQREYVSLAGRIPSMTDRKRAAVIRNETRNLYKALSAAREAFRRGPYRLYEPALQVMDLEDSELHDWACQLKQRYEDRIEDGISGVLQRMDHLVETCSEYISKGADHGTNGRVANPAGSG